jgi:hypothetical protein
MRHSCTIRCPSSPLSCATKIGSAAVDPNSHRAPSQPAGHWHTALGRHTPRALQSEALAHVVMAADTNADGRVERASSTTSSSSSSGAATAGTGARARWPR